MEQMSKKRFTDMSWDDIIKSLPIELIRTNPNGSGMELVATVVGKADDILDLTTINPVMRKRIENIAALARAT